MNKPFTISINEKDPLTKIIEINGELREGAYIKSEEVQTIFDDATKSEKNCRIIFDLKNVTFWDSVGIRKITSAIKSLNETHTKMSGFLTPDDKHLMVMAGGKIKGDNLYHANSLEELN